MAQPRVVKPSDVKLFSVGNTMYEFNEEQILALITRKFESLRVDYKTALDLSDDKHKQELVKDVSAQANTTEIDDTLVGLGMNGYAGCIIVGVTESGQLHDITHLKLDDAKLQQIVNEHIVPRIQFLFRSIEVISEDGKPVKIGAIVIPASDRCPHRVRSSYRGLRQNQCFVREGTSTREASDHDFEGMYARRLGMASEEIDIHRLRSYLEVVAKDERFIRWLDPFYLEARGELLPIYASPFDDCTSDTYSKTNLFEVVYQKDRVIVLGEAGIGKTTALERLMLECASGSIVQSDSSMLPILVPLLYYNGSLLRSVWASLSNYTELGSWNEQETNNLLRNTKCFLMLDGLNEVPGRWRDTICADIVEFMCAFPQHKYIITCRPQDELWRQMHSEKTVVMVLQRLRSGDVRRYLTIHLGEVKGGRLFGAIGEQMRDLARVPLILWLIRNSALAGEEILSNSRGELISGFIRTMLRRESSKGLQATTIPLETKFLCLSALAYSMQFNRTLVASGTLVRESFIHSLQEQKEAFIWRDVLEEAKLNGMLIGENDIYFSHQMFQDFFAASVLAKRLNCIDVTELACDNWWSETFVLLSGIVPNTSSLIDSFAGVAPLLAIRCVAESRTVEADTRRKVLACLEGQLERGDLDLRLDAVRMLRRIGGLDAAQLLLRYLADPDERVRSSARYSLAYIGQDVVPILISALPRSDGFLQKQIVSVLAKLPPPKEPSAIDYLLPLLKVGRPTGKQVARIIVKLGECAIEPMIAILKDSKMPAAANAVLALGYAPGEKAVTALISALDHRSVEVRQRAAQALIRRGNAVCTGPLIQALADPDDVVCYYSMIALSKHAGPEAIPVLKRMLNNARGRQFRIGRRTVSLDLVLQSAINQINARVS